MLSALNSGRFLANKAAWAAHYGILDVPTWLRDYQKHVNPSVKRRLLLAPVGHGKSWWAAKVEALHAICYNKDVRILIISKTFAQAKNDAQMIRTELDRNKQLCADYDIKPTERWGDTEFTVQRPSNLKEPTVTALGLYGQIEGMRLDLIICDDIVDQQVTFSENEREKTRHWADGTLLARLEPEGTILAIGTRWHPEDIYAHLMKKPHWSTVVEKAIKDDGSALWPERWPLDKLAAKRAEDGETWFQFKYMNNPVALEGAAFKPEWLQYVDSLPDGMRIVVGVDPAATKRELAKADPDATALATVGFKDGNIYILDFVLAYIDSNYADVIANAVVKWHASEAAVESNMFQKLIVRDMQTRYASVPVTAVEHYATDKVTRILDLQPRFQSHQVYVWNQCGNLDKFQNEYLGFPTAKHDDILDALEIAVKRVTSSEELEFIAFDL